MKEFAATKEQIAHMVLNTSNVFFSKVGTVPTKVADLVQFHDGETSLMRVVTVVATQDTCPALKKGWVAISTRAVHRAEIGPEPQRNPPRPVRGPSDSEQSAHRAGRDAAQKGWSLACNPHNVRKLRVAWEKGWTGEAL